MTEILMTDDQKKDEALENAGKILIEAFTDMYGKISFNLQGRRKTVHANLVHEVGVEISENKQFLNADNRQGRKQV